MTSESHSDNPFGTASEAGVDLKLEVVVIPVEDVDRAKEFYSGQGWRLDADFSFDNGFRIVQVTPPGSGASIQFGTNMTSAQPGSAQNLYLIVTDIEAARDALAARGVKVSEVIHPAAFGDQFQADPSGHLSGRSPDSYSSFAAFRTRAVTGGCCRRSPPGYPGASTPA